MEFRLIFLQIFYGSSSGSFKEQVDGSPEFYEYVVTKTFLKSWFENVPTFPPIILTKNIITNNTPSLKIIQYDTKT